MNIKKHINRDISYFTNIEEFKNKRINIEMGWSLLLITDRDSKNELIIEIVDYCLLNKLSFVCCVGFKSQLCENLFDSKYMELIRIGKIREENYYIVTAGSDSLNDAIFNTVVVSFDSNNKEIKEVVIINLSKNVSLKKVLKALDNIKEGK